MKTLRFIGMALFAVLMCVNLATCSSDDVAPNEPKEYTVSLGFTGEISVSESPLSRASGNDLYGIQVYSCPTNGTTYTYYAYGLFDDTSLMTISLLSGYKYKFVATIAKKGKALVKNGTLNSKEGYQLPFNNVIVNGSTITSYPTAITNTFTISSTEYFESLAYSTTTLAADGNTYNRPFLERLHGEYTDFIPSQDNNSLEISMKRVSFGFKYVFEDFSEGSLTIDMESAPQKTFTNTTTSYEGIVTMADLSASTDECNITITWTKDDGTIVSLGTHPITFKRNKLTTITIKVSDVTSENGIGFIYDDSMTDGENVTIENGEIVDTSVDTGTEE